MPTARIMFVNFGGLGNGVAAAGLFVALERGQPGAKYVHNECLGLIEPGFVEALKLDGLLDLYPAAWRRFAPSDWDAIEDYLDTHAIDTIINLRNEGPTRDQGYAAFKEVHAKRFRFLDLDEEHLRPASPPRNIFASQHELLRAITGSTGSLEEGWLSERIGLRGARCDRKIGLFTGASQPVKRWTASRWMDVSHSLRAQLDCEFILFGSADPAEAALTDHMNERLLAHGANVRVAQATSSLALAREIAQLDLLISNDTSAVHLAAALGVPTVGLYFSTDATVWGGLSSHFRGVQSRTGLDCPDQKPGAGNCVRFYSGCPAPCRFDVDADQVTGVALGLIRERTADVSLQARAS
jgi:ADP-heptose:LPS heptosyltransferase